MKRTTLFILICISLKSDLHSQGCILVRNLSGFGQYNPIDRAYTNSSWLLNVNNRFFKAYHDYKYGHDQNTAEQNRNVIYSYTIDFVLTKMLAKGWSLSLYAPISANSRTASLEHSGLNTERHTTHSFGLGDIIFTAYKWLIKPVPNQRWNIQVGLGIKFATGNYNYMDYFYKNHDSTRVLAPVNGSIQLGDGGTGITTELNTYYFFTESLGMYANFFYLLNPRDQNGVSTLTGSVATPNQIKATADVSTVPDQYSLRGGFNYIVRRLVFSAGVRGEGIPVYDLLGESNGIRRAGYNLSVEPGVTYNWKLISVYAYVPVFFKHEIYQGETDKRMSQYLGTPQMGMGGSGDYMIFLGAMFKL